ncbi:hypothetical protein H6A11_08745, partial [Bifidobacterium pullorum subsp. saeculare]|uniref:hypothetical protein n=1 Tax=Bifidobacterium pullorum TaxID=78448 RepID=UPI001959B90A
MADLMTDPRQVTQVEMIPGQSTEGTEYEELVRAVAKRELLRRRSEEKKDFIRRAMRSLALNGFASNIRNARKRLPVLRKEANRLYD